MQLIDFEYNGEKLSDYSLMLCNFDSSNDEIEIANSIEINKVKAPNSYKYMSVGYSYDDALTIDFSICKSMCNDNNIVISDVELNKIMRWLNRKRFCKFKPIYDDNSFKDVYFYGTFNIQPVKMGYDIIGLNLTFTTNAPFGFVDPLTYSYTFNATKAEFIINDTSDEVGHLYCDVTIKCLEAGDLKISNSLDSDNQVIIKNCTLNETITLRGEQKIIETDSASHSKLYNDFNYNFLRINNTYDDTKNVFTSSLSCEMTVTYSPVRKVGLIV